jgi:hypothetical protein
LLGGAQGFFMPRPTAAQRASLIAGQPTPLLGAHSVGAPDGGPGLPITHWNRQAGDLRVAHFLGLHGLQVLPLLGWAMALLARRRRASHGSTAGDQAALRAVRLVVIGAGAYIGLMLATLVQALQGRALVSPAGWRGGGDGWPLVVGGLVMLAFAGLAWRQRPPSQDHGLHPAPPDTQPARPRASLPAPHAA